MAFELTGINLKLEKFSYQTEVNEILQIQGDNEIGLYLSSHFQSDFNKGEDLLNWLKVLTRLVDILKVFSLKIGNVVNNLNDHEDNIGDISVICSILRFLVKLIRVAKDKRVFIAFDVLEYLLSSINLEVVELTLELIFYVCVPCSSISQNSGDDWVDSIEVPLSIGARALKIFLSLSQFKQDLGLIEYVRCEEQVGRRPPRTIELRIPQKNNQQVAVVVESIYEYSAAKVLQWKQEKLNDLSSEDFWVAVLVERLLSGYQANISYREMLTKLKLYALFILIHSKVSPASIEEYVKSDSPFLVDLLAISDLPSNSNLFLGMGDPMHLSYIALENVLGLIESKLNRRSPLKLDSGILDGLDLNGESAAQQSSQLTAASSGEDGWINIILSICSLSNCFIYSSFANITNNLMVDTPDNIDNLYSSSGKLVRLGLELYALALTNRDDKQIVNDIRVISYVITLLQSFIPELKFILSKKAEDVKYTPDVRSQQILLIIYKLLHCLECTASKNGYNSAFRECNGLEPIMSILEVFGTCSCPLQQLFNNMPPTISVVETAISIATVSIQKSRSLSLALNRSLSESGFSFLYDAKFGKLGLKIFTAVESTTTVVLVELLGLVKEAIDYEPTYLSHFLKTDLAVSFKTALRNPQESIFQRLDLECLLLCILRLANTFSITAEGKEFVLQTKVYIFVVDAVTHSSILLPSLNAISADRVAKLGSILAQAYLENEGVREQIKSKLKTKFLELFQQLEKEAASGGNSFIKDSTLSGSRLQVLQSIANISTLTENMFTELRRLNGSLVRDILLDCIPHFFMAYQYSLPPPTQMIAQSSLRSTLPYPQYGFVPTIKAITSLLKVLASLLPQDIMQQVLSKLDEIINLVNQSKKEMENVLVETAAAPSKGSLWAIEMEEEGASPMIRRKSRGNSLGNQPCTLSLITGALDTIPHVTLVDPKFQAYATNENFTKHHWKFLTGTVTIEWLSILLAQSVRSLQRISERQLSALLSCKEQLRHFYAFHKSALSEMCKFISKNIASEDKVEYRIKNVMEGFYLDPAVSNEYRIAEEYHLRITGSGGALVREDLELDGSRVVLIIETGTEIVAFERKLNAQGIIRYRTKYGWLSEFRRDQYRNPIIEVLNIKSSGPCAADRLVVGNDANNFSIMFTAREGMCNLLARLPQSLRQVSVYLARLLHVSGEARSMTPSLQHCQLSTFMSKCMKSFLDFINEEDADGNAFAKEASNNEEERQDNRDATKFLYYTAYAKNVLSPCLEDKNGNFNLLLLRSCCTNGTITSFLSSFRYTSTKISQLSATSIDGKIAAGGRVSRTIRCGFHAFTAIMPLLRKLVHRKTMTNSFSNRSTFTDEVGQYHAHELIYQILTPLTSDFIFMIQNGQWSLLPPDLLCELISETSELIINLHTPLSLPPESSRNRDSSGYGGYSSGRRGGQASIDLFGQYLGRDDNRSGGEQSQPPSESRQFLDSLLALDMLQNHAPPPSAAADNQLATPSISLPPLPPSRSAEAVGITAAESFPEASSTGVLLSRLASTPHNIDLPDLVNNLSAWESRATLSPSLVDQTAELGIGRSEAGSDSSRGDLHKLMAKEEEMKKSTPQKEVVKTPSDNMKVWFATLSSAFKDFIFLSLRKFHIVSQREKKDSFYLIHHIREVLMNVKKESTADLLPDIFQSALAGISKLMDSNNNNDENNLEELSGLCAFCAAIYHFDKQEKFLLSYQANLQLLTRCSSMIISPNYQLQDESGWLSSLVVILAEISSAVISSPSFFKEQLNLLLKTGNFATGSSSVNSSCAEKEENVVLADSKEEEVGGSRDDAKGALQSLLRATLALIHDLQDKVCSKSLGLALMQLSCNILSYHQLADSFVFEDGLSSLLTMKKKENSEDTDPISINEWFSRLLQRCFETSSFLRQSFTIDILAFFDKRKADEVPMALDKFLSCHSKLIARSPDDFWYVCTKLLMFHRKKESVEGRKVTKMTISVSCLEKRSIDSLDLKRKEPRSLAALQCLVSFLLKFIQTSEETTLEKGSPTMYISPSDCLQAFADNIILISNGPASLSKQFLVIQSNRELLEALIHRLLYQPHTPVDQNQATKYTTGVNRLLMALVADNDHKVRSLVVSSVVLSLPVKELSGMSGALDDVQMKAVERYCRLIYMLSQATKAVSEKMNPVRERMISLDWIQLLFTSPGFIKSLVNLLVSLSSSQIQESAQVALLDVLELLSRPAILQKLDEMINLQTVKSDAKDSETKEGENTDHTAVEVAGSATSGANDVHAIATTTINAGNEQYVDIVAAIAAVVGNQGGEEEDLEGEEEEDDEQYEEEQEYGEQYDNMNHAYYGGDDDDEEEDDEMDHDEDVDDDHNDNDEEEDHDEDDHDDDEDDPDDEDHDDDHHDNDGHANAANHDIIIGLEDSMRNDALGITENVIDMYPDVHDNSFVHVDVVATGDSNRIRDAVLQSVARSGFESNNNAAAAMAAGTYITPPQQRDMYLQSLIQSMIESAEPQTGHEQQHDSILDIMRRLGVPTNLPPHAMNMLDAESRQQIANATGMDMDITGAAAASMMTVRRSTATHPILDSSMNRLAAYGDPTDPSFTGQDAAFNNNISPRGVYNGRAVFHFSTNPATGSSNNMDGWVIRPPGSGITSDLYNALSGPAVWPGNQNGNGPSHRSDSAVDERNSMEYLTEVSETFQQTIESLLTNEISSNNGIASAESANNEDGGTAGEDASSSQSTMTFNSRGGPVVVDVNSFSMPGTSLVAVQDPNLRQRGEGGDDGSARGGPIPPLIEIESRDNEANEEMSVLTLPQDTAGNEEDATRAPSATPMITGNAGGEAAPNEEDQLPSSVLSGNEEVNAGLAAAPTNDSNEMNLLTADINLINLIPANLSQLSPAAVVQETASSPIETADRASPSIEQNPPVAPVVAIEEDISASIVVEESKSEAVEEVSSPASVESSEIVIIAPTTVDESSDQPQEEQSEQQLACPPGYDVDVFYSLPPDMQQEVIDQHSETTDQLRELIAVSGFDYETIMSLPDDIRQEILDQARRQQRDQQNAAAASSASAAPQEIDNATFLASLTLELRNEVLLTADAAFLASLPPEIAAEAQTLRDRAASTWQRREIIAQATGNAGIPAAGSGASSGASGEGADMLARDYDMDGEYEEDYPEDPAGYIPRRSAAAGRGAAVPRGPDGRAVAVTTIVKNGFMAIPMDINLKIKMPVTLLFAAVRSLLTNVKYSSRFTDRLLGIINNTYDTMKEKFLLSSLLSALIFNDQRMIDDSMRAITNGEEGSSSLLQGISLEEGQITYISSKADVGQADTAATDTRHCMSEIALKRLVFVLTALFRAHSGFTLSFLFPRGQGVNIITKYLETVDNRMTMPPILPSDYHQQSSSSLTAGGNISLLEFLLLRQPVLHTPKNIIQLDAFTTLIDQITSPLENVPDSFSAGGKEAITAEVTQEMVEKDQKNNTVTWRVPLVCVGRNALSNLCDLLLNDACNSTVFSSVICSISRLAKVNQNCLIISEIIGDIVVGLSHQAKDSLDIFAGKLVDAVQASEATNSGSSSSSASSSANAASKSIHIPYENTAKRPLNQFLRLIKTLQSICIKNGNQIFEKTPVDELVPVWSALDGVLQNMKLLFLKENRNREEDAASSSGGKVEISPQITSLTALLRQFLPLIEAYFIIYTSDLLRETVEEPKEVAATTTTAAVVAAPATAGSSESSSTAGATAEADVSIITPSTLAAATVDSASLSVPPTPAASMNVTTASSSTSVSSPTFTAAVLGNSGGSGLRRKVSGSDGGVTSETKIQLSTKIPGQVYRSSKEYMRANISLPLDVSSHHTSSLDRSDSITHSHHSLHHHASSSSPNAGFPLTKTISLGHVNSIASAHALVSSKYQRLVGFVANHQVLLNILIKSKSSLLDTSLASCIRVVQLRSSVSFENKRNYFFAQLKKSQRSPRRGIHIQVRRHQVFEDTYQQLRGRAAADWRGRLQVTFYGEEAVDAGGVGREWYTILAREIFNPNYALFMAAADGATFQPNPLSFINSNHLDYFRFVGRIIGKAVIDSQLMDAHFTRSFYKHLLGMPIEFMDIEATEPDYYKSLKMMLSQPLEDLGFNEMTFTAEIQKFGKTEDVELIPNGSRTTVTDENKYDYVRLMAHHRMTSAIAPQIDAFLSGFYDLVPPELICIFSPTELELLICGLPDVNIEELYVHTEYHQYRPTDDMILWFWEILRSFNREEKALFLQFVTGTSKVPLGGFAQLQGMRGTQKFSVHRAFGGENGALPTAHTCYNQMDLPVYSTSTELREKLMLAIKEGSEGFGFA